MTCSRSGLASTALNVSANTTVKSQGGLSTSGALLTTLHLIRVLGSEQRKCSRGSMSMELTDLTTYAITWKQLA